MFTGDEQTHVRAGKWDQMPLQGLRQKEDCTMKLTLHSTLLAALVGLGSVAAQAETIGIGDDTLEFVSPEAAELRPDVTRERGVNGTAPVVVDRDVDRAGNAPQDAVSQARRYDHL